MTKHYHHGCIPEGAYGLAEALRRQACLCAAHAPIQHICRDDIGAYQDGKATRQERSLSTVLCLSWCFDILYYVSLIDIGFRLNYALLIFTSSFACSAGLCLPYISQRYDCNGNAEGYRKQPPWTSPRLCHYFLSPEGSMSHGRGIGLLDLS